MTTYPTTPGFKASGTSQDAALEIKPHAQNLREGCLRELAAASLTADEVANRLDSSILAIRPRISELKALGQIMDSGMRRPNSSGHKAVVWTVK